MARYSRGMAGLLDRGLLGRAREYLDFSPVLVVQGARQTGKSSLAQMLAGDQARSLTLDDAGTADAAREDPRGFVEQADDGLLVIDEIQRLPELTLAVKAAVDRNRRPGRFILTGSSDVARIRGHKDSLAGRALSVRLHPLSQAELRGTLARGAFVDRLLGEGGDPAGLAVSAPLSRADVVGMLLRGGYPSVREAPARLRAAWLSDYVERLLGVDAREGGGRLDPLRLTSVLRLIAANQSGELVKARIAREAALSAASVTGYLDALDRLYLTEDLQPWTVNLTAREIGRRKVRVADCGLAAWLCGASADLLKDVVRGGRTLGAILEGFVVGELSSQAGWAETGYRLFHYRDRRGHEVDVIIELDDGRVIAVEVKSAVGLTGRHFAGLMDLRERLGERLVAGVVLAPVAEPMRYAEGLWGLPLSTLWE